MLPRILPPSFPSSSPNSATVLFVDAEWQPIVDKACRLKDALDHVVRWNDESRGVAWIESTLAFVGFSSADFASGWDASEFDNFPDHFARVYFGSWFSRNDEKNVGWVRVPQWCVLGWVRKRQYRTTPMLQSTVLTSMANDVENSVIFGHDTPTVHCVAGIPLIMAGEGKNRAQLYRNTNVARTSLCRWHTAPDFAIFEAMPMYFMPGIVIVKWVEKDQEFIEALPFLEISKPLLIAVGVTWTDKPVFGVFPLFRAIRARNFTWLEVFKMIIHGQKLVRLGMLGLPGIRRQT